MKTQTVAAIIRPYKQGVPLYPSVQKDEKLSRAIELMMKFNLKCIVVTRGVKPLGLIRLTDAFQKLGLNESKK
jgi:predicted transcriptional regulator